MIFTQEPTDVRKPVQPLLLYSIVGGVATALLLGGIGVYLVSGKIHYSLVGKDVKTGEFIPPAPKPFEATHITTPLSVRGVYMTNWLAGARDKTGRFYMRESLEKIISDTELNALVLDIKDDTGRIGHEVYDEELIKIGSSEKRIPDIRDFLAELHVKNIYVIGRIATFQDPYLVKARPNLAIRRLATIAKDAYKSGFDEIQFDYARFPTDGDLSDLAYPFFDSAVQSKSDQIRLFFSHIHRQMEEVGIPHSVDLFGLTTTALDDMGIGQLWENAIPYFDYLSPMVYPSHYAPGSYGYQNPNESAYEVVKAALENGVARLLSASSTPNKLRPWLQDFDLGGRYDAEKVRKQIQATYDVGLNSWLLWDPSATYETGAFLPR